MKGDSNTSRQAAITTPRFVPFSPDLSAWPRDNAARVIKLTLLVSTGKSIGWRYRPDLFTMLCEFCLLLEMGYMRAVEALHFISRWKDVFKSC